MELTEAEQKLERLTWMINWAGAFLLFFVVSMTALMLWQAFRLGSTTNEVKNVAITTHDSLCAFKQDLQTRYDSGSKVLNQHPEDPVRIYGLVVPRSQLVQSNQSQAATLESLSALDCDT
ncbi:MAG TPA: hypothetical protein VLA89_06495 [Gemmatimonadales bacterium]|nr:hypothetical protein [Gemmatimonadales bacterium]